MPFTNWIFGLGIFISSFAFAQNSQPAQMDDGRWVLVKGISKSDLCARLVGSRPETAPLAWALDGRDRLTADGIKRMKENLPCFTGTENFCEVVNAFDLNPKEQSLEISKNRKNFGVVSTQPMNQDRTTFKLKRVDDILMITSNYKNSGKNTQVEFELKYINGVCVPWAFRNSKGLGRVFNLQECTQKVTEDCQKNPYWQFYQSQLTSGSSSSGTKIKSEPPIK